MCGYFCIGFSNFLLASKFLIDYTILFLPYHFEKYDKIILSEATTRHLNLSNQKNQKIFYYRNSRKRNNE